MAGSHINMGRRHNDMCWSHINMGQSHINMCWRHKGFDPINLANGERINCIPLKFLNKKHIFV